VLIVRSTVQYSAVQYSTVQYSTVEYSECLVLFVRRIPNFVTSNVANFFWMYAALFFAADAQNYARSSL